MIPKRKLKIRFATFELAKYGGIIQQIEAKMEAFKRLGHDVDIIMLKYDKNLNEKGYNRKIAELESGEFQNKIELHSQNGGYEKSKISGYWRNSYYGWILPPRTNAIPVFNENALTWWHELVDDVDILIWDFMPTKTSEAQGFDFWWKFFDLSKRVKQIFKVHDAYFDMRTSWITELREKILFLDCAHITSYKCCANIAVPRNISFNWRIFPDEMQIIPMKDRELDFFSAHIFKSMKKMEDVIRAVPYLNSGESKHDIFIGGSGIEYSYMTSPTKTKETYKCKRKYDPDLPESVEKSGISIWDYALQYGMEYVGLLGKNEMDVMFDNTKFIIDASHCKHYAKYCRTHLNGFVIEGVIKGSYPVVRDYSGLSKEFDGVDPIFDGLRAIVIPWDATPKQFAQYLKKALKMSPEKYLEDTKHNFEFLRLISDGVENAKSIIRLAFNEDECLNDLEVGKDSELVKRQSKDVMENFFGIELPIQWTN